MPTPRDIARAASVKRIAARIAATTTPAHINAIRQAERCDTRVTKARVNAARAAGYHGPLTRPSVHAARMRAR